MKDKNRSIFRNAVFKRDKYKCRTCPVRATPETANTILDAHHIWPRHEMPNGGYVIENGISLCKQPRLGSQSCHEKAEEFFAKGEALPGFHPDDLFILIGSTRDKAEKASLKL